ncbi:class I SAM-dependent methyltransferase [Methanosarcina sp. MSH10X1]|uniref:class I SAM-dependent methyltransferase n=1 Tax=Methanosarcina sp. MSH10X1 TaxID=2507075 RepID=UPI000FFB514B|nr:class I SAM-dependent methyltransferase [Methanosarcina sp. MSH10X1]RXA20529.1 class I SAM-dependent methyltransferase [Methanosarcina sp. MSH10X1]
MLLQELLGIDEEVYFVEESYIAQRTIERTIDYLNGVRRFAEEGLVRLLRVREGEHTLGLLLFNPANDEVPVDFWSVFTGAFAGTRSKKAFEALADSILTSNLPEKDIEISSESWRDAVNEYYSLMLVNRNLCAACAARPQSYGSVFSESRIQRVAEIFGILQKKGLSPEGRLLEVCCGNGMSTLALYRLGLDPLAIEINKCAVCQGLEQGVLNPQKTVIMDATALSRYFEQGSFDAVMGFMLGLVYEFNKELWTGIMREAVSVANEGALMLFTVSSRPEIEILAEALFRAGVKGEIVDNTDSDGTYDQWFFVGRKQKA